MHNGYQVPQEDSLIMPPNWRIHCFPGKYHGLGGVGEVLGRMVVRGL